MLCKWALTTVLIGVTVCWGPDQTFGQGRFGGGRGGRAGGGGPRIGGGGGAPRIGGGGTPRVGAGGGTPRIGGGGTAPRLGGGTPRIGGGNPGGGIGNRIGGAGNPGGRIGNRPGGANRIGGLPGGIGSRQGTGITNPIGRPGTNVDPGRGPVNLTNRGGRTPTTSGLSRVTNRLPRNNPGGPGRTIGGPGGPGLSNSNVADRFGLGGGAGIGRNPGIGGGPGIGRNPGIGGGPGIGRNPGIGRGPGIGNNILGNRIGNGNLGNRIGGGNTIIAGNTINAGGNTINTGYAHHPGYYGGWNPNYYGPGYGAYAPLAWGLAGYGLGALAYSSGYVPYSNPYYVLPVDATPIYDYGQPIPVEYTVLPADTGVTPSPTPTSTEAQDELFQKAVAAFQTPDYEQALDLANQGIGEFPTDPMFHEFRGLTQFAKGDYQQAAATIHSVLAVGPGWNWTTMSGMYADVGQYTDQLRSLEGHVREHSQDAAPRFLLGYHYMTTGHPESAAKQFEKVAALQPNDQLANSMLQMLSPPDPTQGESPTETPTDSAPPAVDPKSLPGTWKATRDDGSVFQLTLSHDDKFEWQYSQGEQEPVEFGGMYQLDGNILALQQTDGQALMAMLTPEGDSQLNFKLVGAPPQDPGLKFQR